MHFPQKECSQRDLGSTLSKAHPIRLELYVLSEVHASINMDYHAIYKTIPQLKLVS